MHSEFKKQKIIEFGQNRYQADYFSSTTLTMQPIVVVFSRSL